MVRHALVLVAFASLAGCAAPPPAPPVADLDIKKMPDAGTPPPALPVAAGSEKKFVMAGKCGEAEVGKLAPPLRPGILAGKTTVVLFWATWAAPAREEMEKLQALYRKDRGRLDIIALSVDDEKRGVFEFAKERGAGYTIAWDEDHRAAQCWKVDTMPMAYVIDPAGILRHIHAGYRPGEVDTIAREIEQL